MENNTNNTTDNSEKIQSSKFINAESRKKQERFLLILIVVIVAGILFVLYKNGVLSGNSGQKVIEDYLQSICSRQFDDYIGCMPEKIAADHIADRDEMGLGSVEYMSRLYSDYFDEFGEDMAVINVEFTGKSRPDAVYIDNFKQSYSELYGEEIKISSVFEIDADVTFSGSLKADVVQFEFFVAKTEGKWKVVGADYKTVDANSVDSFDSL